MKARKRLLSLLLAIVMIVTAFAGCGQTKEQEAAQPTEGPAQAGEAVQENQAEEQVAADYLDKVVTVGQISTWGLLCPFSGTDSYSVFVYEALYEKLIVAEGDYTISPRAADSWDVNEDSTVWTFYLNKDVKWHDGTPLTAEDWVFAAQTVTDPSFVSGRKSVYANFVGTDADGNETAENSVAWEAVDEYTLRVTLKQPTEIVSFLIAQNNCMYPLPKHLLADIDTAALLEDAYWQNPVGCGVGIFDSQVEGSTITFKTNQEYYRGAPKFGTLVFRVVAQDSIAASFMSGELDLCYSGMSNADDALAASAQPNVETAFTAGYPNLCWMNINVEKLSDVRLRHAVRYCIDQENIMNVLWSGEGVVSASPTMQIGDYYTDSIEYAAEYNPEKAKQLFDEAGWDYNETFIIGTPSGSREKGAAMIQQSLESIGIKCEIEIGDASTIFANAKEGKYHVSLQSISSVTNDPLTFRNSMNNWIHGFADGEIGAELNGLLDQLSSELDQEKRAAISRQWLERVTELCPMACVWRIPQYMVISSRLKNWDPDRQAVGFNTNYHELIVE